MKVSRQLYAVRKSNQDKPMAYIYGYMPAWSYIRVYKMQHKELCKIAMWPESVSRVELLDPKEPVS